LASPLLEQRAPVYRTVEFREKIIKAHERSMTDAESAKVHTDRESLNVGIP
jgi:hypothetical protein